MSLSGTNDEESARASARKMRILVEAVANSGLAVLDASDVKAIKRMCKTDPACIPLAFKYIKAQLKRKHSQARLATLQLADELFQRSHVFRELAVEELSSVVNCVVETDSASPLPPPKEARDKLKKLGLQTLKKWQQQFGGAYKKLDLGINYLKQVKNVDFDDGEGRNDLQRRRDEERQRRIDNIWRERVKRCQQEMSESRDDIVCCLTEMDACFELLVPKPENFDFCSDKEACIEREEDSEGEQDSRREHGIVNHRQTISLDLGAVQKCATAEHNPSDDSAVVENLRERLLVVRNKLLPLVKKWTVIITKGGNSGDSDFLKSAIDFKQRLEEAESKAKALHVDVVARAKAISDSDSDDDDFVEVEEKSGYEEFAVAPVASTSRAALATLTGTSEKSDSQAEDEPCTSKSVVGVAGENSVSGSSEGWTCRARLPSGRLCPRRDHVKCPLHGAVIPRDKLGEPSKLEDRLAAERTEEDRRQKNPDWQDPNLLKEIKASTGIDLAMPTRKRKGHFGRRNKDHPGLVNIAEQANTTRKRLEKKLFKRCSVNKQL